MNNKWIANRLARPLLLGAALGGLVLCASANVPQPACVLYGQVKSEYGWPMTEGEIHVAFEDGTVFETDIAFLDPGVNFAIALPLDDGKGLPYDEGVVHSGARFSVTIIQYGMVQGVIETNLPAVGGPGSVVQMNITRGVDSIKDGVPDAWKLEFVENSGGAYTHISQIRPHEDFDGDGMDNLTEYLSGTYAFDDRDYFYVEQTGQEQGRMAVSFFGVKGFTYYPQMSDGRLEAGAWSDAAFATTPGGVATEAAVIGAYRYINMYLNTSNLFRHIRMLVY